MFVHKLASERRRQAIVVKVSRAERAANKAAREQVAAQLERRWAKILGRWNTPAMISELEGHIETQGTVGLIDGPLKYGDLEAEIGAAMDESFRDALGRGREIGLRFSGLPGVELDPALATQRAVQWIESTGAERIAGITGGMRQSVRGFLTDQITDRISPTDAARKIGRVVGLDERGMKALQNFEDRLIRIRIPTPEADTVRVRRAINQEVERYRQRLLRDRGRRIAETETQVAIQQGEKQWWDQAVAEGHIERPEAAQKRWYTVADGSVCQHCEPLHGKIVPIDGLFATSLGPASEPPLHVRCRCYLERSADGFGPTGAQPPAPAPEAIPVAGPAVKEKQLRDTLKPRSGLKFIETGSPEFEREMGAASELFDPGAGLTGEQASLLSEYKSRGYKQMNEALRGGGEPSGAQAIRDALSVGKTRSDAIVWRGIGDMDKASPLSEALLELKVGDKLPCAGFQSVTTSRRVAEGFAQKNSVGKPILMRVNVKKGTRSAFMDVEEISMGVREEAELLLSDKAEYRVRGISRHKLGKQKVDGYVLDVDYIEH